MKVLNLRLSDLNYHCLRKSVNAFVNSGLKIFGPKKEAALIESSKIFSKKLMVDNNIPTASYRSFSGSNLKEAKLFAGQCRSAAN